MVRERRKVSRVTAELPCATRLGASGPRSLKGRSQTATPVLRSANARPAPRSLASGAGVTPGLIVLSARSCFTYTPTYSRGFILPGLLETPISIHRPSKPDVYATDRTEAVSCLETCDQKVLDEEITSRQNSCRKGSGSNSRPRRQRVHVLVVKRFSSDPSLCWR